MFCSGLLHYKPRNTNLWQYPLVVYWYKLGLQREKRYALDGVRLCIDSNQHVGVEEG